MLPALVLFPFLYFDFYIIKFRTIMSSSVIILFVDIIIP
jgi:hypothetical protein